MIVHHVEQGTDEWHALRAGKITATGFAKVLSSGKGRHDYMLQLAAERMTGIPQPSYCNSIMQRGIDEEPYAREQYEALYGVCVETVGFIEADEWVGVSVDGLVVEDGIIEIKCPNTTTHIETILKNKLPSQYKPQVQGILWVSQRHWCDFISYDSRMPFSSLYIKRIYRDEKYITALAAAVNDFKQELQDLINEIKPKF